jgi:hypothetical protein
MDQPVLDLPTWLLPAILAGLGLWTFVIIRAFHYGDKWAIPVAWLMIVMVALSVLAVFVTGASVLWLVMYRGD